MTKFELEELLQREYQNMAGLVVMKNDELVYERYANDCDSTSTLHIYSVTKSILSLLIGIAIDRGFIKSIDQPILAYFPEYPCDKEQLVLPRVTIKDMLTMVVPYQFEIEPYLAYFTSEDRVRFALDAIGGGTIGEFHYAALVGPDILSAILTRACGQSVLSFAKENLFNPMDIVVENSIVFHSAEEQMAFHSSTTQSGWVIDDLGIHTAGWGLTLSARDMAKIGQLYLQRGRWKNLQLVSSAWIEESIQIHSEWKELGLTYGYLWWVFEDGFCAMGDGGNVIYVNDKKHMVIAITSLFEPDVTDRLDLIKGVLEPMFERDVSDCLDHI